ncbi:diaminopimelate decarboxylase [Granulicoccus phenolivorans]|uniref:diaminopimelate decarboxylase n=1 Tax=Granulicoccus phenolivorans TaxID=266854 RepID=UPI000479F0FF|nr:diaminopimelate decarboxylase [Granulicoccus phenolivorans]
MTHMHVAGSIHADAVTPAPKWLREPDDVNALMPGLWSQTVERGADGALRVGGVDVRTIAAEVGTPAYIMDEVDFRARARAYATAFAGWEVYYAAKSFCSIAACRWAAEEGLGVDVCSGGELTVALRAGVNPATIGLHGNNKTIEELELAITAGVGRIVIDSFIEIDRIIELARTHGRTVPVMVRVTAGVEAHTHEYIATAHEDQKFGLSIATGEALIALERCQAAPELDLRGIHSHIGSQIFDTAGFEVAVRRTLGLHAELARATGQQMPELDLGGGFGIRYTAQDQPIPPAELAAQLNEIVDHECRALEITRPGLSIEPGRSISGPAGMALYEVGTVKDVTLDGGAHRCYISVDGGMSDNIRPALYGAEYSATLADRRSAGLPRLSRVVGKHCESGDILVRDEFLPDDVTPGDLIAVPASGAYSRAMANNYNHALRPPVIAVADGKWRTLIRRETLEDLLGLDQG